MVLLMPTGQMTKIGSQSVDTYFFLQELQSLGTRKSSLLSPYQQKKLSIQYSQREAVMSFGPDNFFKKSTVKRQAPTTMLATQPRFLLYREVRMKKT